MISETNVFEALRRAEHEYVRVDRAQDYMAPDSDGFVDLGPIVPWICKRAAEVSGVPIDTVRSIYYSSEYAHWHKSVGRL